MHGAEPAARLLCVLEQEAQALRQGDLAGLQAVLSEKEKLFADPAALRGVNPTLWGEIRRRAQRNDSLITAARGGLRAALERLSLLRRGDSGLRTYDRSGAASVLSQGGAGPIRRA